MNILSTKVHGCGQNYINVIRNLNLDLEKGPWVAGGAARKIFQKMPLGDSDIDIFFTSNEQRMKFIKDKCGKIDVDFSNILCVQPSYGFEVINEDSGKYKTEYDCKDIVWQFVVNYYHNSIKDQFSVFDYTVCQFATDGYTILYTEDAVKHLNENKLVINNQKFTPKGLPRFCKYIGKGFIPEKGLLEKTFRESGLTTINDFGTMSLIDTY